MAPPLTLTAEEAEHFLKNVLKLSGISNGNKLALLNKIICSFKANIPCHNIGLLSSDTRQIPAWSKIKDEVMAARGELGCVLNVFMCGLLNSLGFEAVLSTAVMYALDAFQTSRLIVLVDNLTAAGDHYLVDVGNEHPTFEAVPLDFKEESPEYRHSYLEYKFMYRDGRILRLHNRGQHDSRAQIDASLDGFYIFYDFDLNSKTEKDIIECLELIYTNPRASPFHKGFRVSVYRDNKCVLLKDNELYTENDEHRLVPTELPTTSELIKAFGLHFPMIEANAVSKALKVVKSS